MTVDEMLNEMESEQISVQSDTPVCVIDPDTRTITVPPEYQLLGVENDKRVERIPFRCPKIVGDNQDLSQDYQLFINYQNANGDPDAYHVEDMEVDGDNITFSWLLVENVTKYKGNIKFAFGAIKPGDEILDPDKNRWNTTINTDCTCLVGLKCTQQVEESNPDALAQIWAAIDELKAGGGGGSYTLPIMSDTQLGGGKAVPKTEENVPVAVDPETGQLFVPAYPSGGGGSQIILLADLQADGESTEITYDVDLSDGLYAMGFAIPAHTPDENKGHWLYLKFGGSGIFGSGLRAIGGQSNESVVNTNSSAIVLVKDGKSWLVSSYTGNTEYKYTDGFMGFDVQNKVSLYSQNSKPVPTGVSAKLWRIL